MNFKSIAARAGTAFVLAMVPLLVVSQASSAAPTTLYVGPSGSNADNNCQASLNPCQTISFALTQAEAGATIRVQAGTYDEQLVIRQAVTILGAGPSQTIIDPSAVTADADTDSTQPQYAIVDAAHTAGVDLKDLGINGSAARSSFDTDGLGCAQNFVGAYFHDASGAMTDDTVTGIELPSDLFGCQGGLGVYAATDSGSLSPTVLTMSSDNVNNYDKNGITCDDPGTACTITNTSVTGIGSTPLVAQNGIQIWAASGSLRSDVVTDNTYDGTSASAAGILIGNPDTLSVLNNTVAHNDTNISLIQDQDPAWVFCGNTGTSCTNPAAAGTTFTFTANHVSDATNVDGNAVGSEFGDGIDLDSVTQPTTLKRNVVDNNAGNGIALLGSTSVTARRNTVRNDFNGIVLDVGTTGVTANADTLRHNTIASSSSDGILATSSSGGNTIVRNSILVDTVFDAQDNSVGTGTAGTANDWVADDCSTSDPSGLCHAAAAPRRAGAAGGRPGSKATDAVRRARPTAVR